MSRHDPRPLARQPEHPIGLVLSGGGARGAFQVGVWEVLSSDPRGIAGHPTVISGTSAGALNGALIAAGRSPREILDFWLGLADDPPVDANRAFFASLERALARIAVHEPLRNLRHRARAARITARLLGKHALLLGSGRLACLVEYLFTARFDALSRLLDGIGTAYLFSTAPARKRLVDALGGTAVPPTPIRLAINTVDIQTGQVIRFVNHPPKKHADADDSHYEVGPITVDMVLASASIPLLFNPVAVNGRELWDGGLLVNTPLAPTVALGASHIVPVLVTEGRANVTRHPLDLGRAIERLADAFLENAYNTDRKLLLERNRLARHAPELGFTEVQLFEAIRPDPQAVFTAGSYLYFERDVMTEMYHAGRRAALRWLAAGPRLDTRPGHPPELDRMAGEPLRSVEGGA